MPLSYPLAQPNCRGCWMPVSRCVCATPGKLARDFPGLSVMRAKAESGAWRGDADRRNIEQRWWAFFLWRLGRDCGGMRTQR